jgi:hypothetical protein
MRRPIIVTTALIVAVVAIAGATIDAKSSRPATAIQASSPIDVMQMMKTAKNLPEERYDAY